MQLQSSFTLSTNWLRLPGWCALTSVSHAKPHNDLLAQCRGLKLDYILNTHHHWDHTGGNEELKRKFNCTIVGPKADQGRIPGIDISLADGESWSFGSLEMQVFDTPGHTKGHITLWFPQIQALFPGKLSCWQCCNSSAFFLALIVLTVFLMCFACFQDIRLVIPAIFSGISA